MSGRVGRRAFGFIRRLPSKRYQASYMGKDGLRYTAPHTFQAKSDAEAWLNARDREIGTDTWVAVAKGVSRVPPAPTLTLAAYAEDWLEHRDLKGRTRSHYRWLLDRAILPSLGDRPLGEIRPADVKRWRASLDPRRTTARAHAYNLLSTIFRSAVAEEEVLVNPCRLRGASTPPRAVERRPATLDELGVIVDAMQPRFQVAILLAAWCALRFGEFTELRRRDVDVQRAQLCIRRGVTRVGGVDVVSTPKSRAGIRDVAIPPHLMPQLLNHMNGLLADGPDALLFPASPGEARHLPASTLRLDFNRASDAAGRPDLTLHDLRHTGAVLAAITGATLPELMARVGHSTPAAALRYQHVAQGRDQQIAAALSRLVPQHRVTDDC